jgi:hypothetical protein
MNKFAVALKLTKTVLALSLTFSPVCSVALAQDSANPPGEDPSEKDSKIVYGAESDFTSGTAWRGLVISERPVVSNAGWISKYGFVALLFGSMVSATDHISVLSIFKEVAVDAVRSVLTGARLTITIDSTRVMYGTSIALLRLGHKSGRFQSTTRQRNGAH